MIFFFKYSFQLVITYFFESLIVCARLLVSYTYCLQNIDRLIEIKNTLKLTILPTHNLVC